MNMSGDFGESLGRKCKVNVEMVEVETVAALACVGPFTVEGILFSSTK